MGNVGVSWLKRWIELGFFGVRVATEDSYFVLDGGPNQSIENTGMETSLGGGCWTSAYSTVGQPSSC